MKLIIHAGRIRIDGAQGLVASTADFKATAPGAVKSAPPRGRLAS